MEESAGFEGDSSPGRRLFFPYPFGYTPAFRITILEPMPGSGPHALMSSREQSSWAVEPDDEPRLRPADAPPVYVSEFVSEQSPEFEDVRRAVADERQRRVPPAAGPVALAPAAPQVPAATGTSGQRVRLMAYASVVLGLLVAAWLFRGQLLPLAFPGAAPPTEGSATITSRPDGAEVFINGEPRGVTPVQLTLPVGTYDLELRNGTATRSLPLAIEAQTAVRESIDLTPAAPTTGRLEITADVPGSAVVIDGVWRGVTPLVVDAIEPGAHRIVIGTGSAAVFRTVTVEAGATATVVASAVPAGATGGWLTFTSPIELQVIENGQILGTTSATRLMVPAGRRELELVGEPYEFRMTTTALVGVGRTVAIPVEVPPGRLSINAVPWADVWLDGQPLGSTPLANLTVAAGDREVVWRHPELGERRQVVRVPVATPARVGVDLTR